MGDLWPLLSYLPLHTAPSLFFFSISYINCNSYDSTTTTHVHVGATHSFFPVYMCLDCDTSIYFVSLICAKAIPPLTLSLLCLHKKAYGRWWGLWPLYSSSQYQDSNSASIFHGLTQSKSRSHPLTVPRGRSISWRLSSTWGFQDLGLSIV